MTIDEIMLNKCKQIYDMSLTTSYRGGLDRLITKIDMIRGLIDDMNNNNILKKAVLDDDGYVLKTGTRYICNDYLDMSMAQIRDKY